MVMMLMPEDMYGTNIKQAYDSVITSVASLKIRNLVSASQQAPGSILQNHKQLAGYLCSCIPV